MLEKGTFHCPFLQPLKEVFCGISYRKKSKLAKKRKAKKAEFTQFETNENIIKIVVRKLYCLKSG